MNCQEAVGALYFGAFFSGLSFILLSVMSRRIQKIESCLAQCLEDTDSEHTD